jgi:hypothetical protein
MKPTTSIFQRNFALSSRHRNRALATAFMTALAPTVAPLAQAAQVTWSGGGSPSQTWSTGANWGGTAPVDNDGLRFIGNTNLSTNNDISNLILGSAGSPAGAIVFGNTSTATGSAFTLAGNGITLGGAIRMEAMTTGSLTEQISLQLILSGVRTINTLANHNLTVSGQVTESSSGVGGILKIGGATLTLSNDTNSFTALTVQQGTLSVTSIASSGTVSAIGAGNTITLGGATTEGIFTFTGTNALMADRCPCCSTGALPR